MKVVMFQSESSQGVGLLVDGRVIDYTRAGLVSGLAANQGDLFSYDSILEMLQDGMFDPEPMAATVGFLKVHGLLDEFTVPDARLLAPIPRPPKIVALGRNYVAHAKELGHEVPTEPTLFQKASTSIIGPGDEILYYKDIDRLDHEIELAVVIGKECSRATEANAMEFVAGYTIINDVTARNMQRVDMERKNPWFRSKSFDTFGPLGPCIVTPDEIGDPHQLQLTCKVNGEVRQNANTRNMIFKIPFMIQYISAKITLEPGDIIATGTPEGISPMNPGEVVECTIENIGMLSNSIVAE